MGNSLVVTPYDLVEITIGKDKVYARPVEWDRKHVDAEGRDIKGEYMVAIRFETACPNCGQLISFSNNLKTAQCPLCKVGVDAKAVEDFLDPFCAPGEYDQE